MEYVSLGDVTYFGITLFNPASGHLQNADETPKYFLYRNASDTASISANFTARAGLIGTYRGSGDITSGNGFSVGDYVEVHASGKVATIQGRAIIKSFVVSDTFNVNVNTWSGIPVNPLNNGNVPANTVSWTGVPLGTTINPVIQNAVWNDRLSKYTTNDTTGSGLWRAGLQVLDVNVAQWRGQQVLLISALPAVAISGISTDAINDNALSESANTELGISARDAILNANLTNFNTNGTVGSGLNKICANIYYAGIKFVKDSVVPRDEYIVQWFRNSLPVSSGEVANPALSVYKTSDGLALTENRVLTQTSVSNGVLRYNESSSLTVSGEPYLVTTSGTIDGSLRIWSNPIGLDYL